MRHAHAPPEGLPLGLVVTIQNYLATTGFPVSVVRGLLFFVCVLIFRSGIVGEIRKRLP